VSPLLSANKITVFLDNSLVTVECIIIYIVNVMRVMEMVIVIMIVKKEEMIKIFARIMIIQPVLTLIFFGFSF